MAQVEEIIVTSSVRNRLEDVRDVPISITQVRGEELERLNAYDVTQITTRAANISWNQGNQRTSSISIRGIGKVGQTEAQDPSVGVIIDGVNYAYNALTSSFDFTDIDVVEVVRGPQGTLLGKNTSLGVLSISTRRPTFTPEFDYAVTIGERDTVLGRAAGGGPIIDDVLAWRGAINFQKARGWLIDPYNPDFSYQNKERVSGRVQLLWTPPNSDLTARLALDMTPRSGEATNGVTINTPAPTTYSNGAPITGLNNEQRLARRYFKQHENYVFERDYFYGGETGYYAGDGSYRRPLVTGSNGLTLELIRDNVGPFTITSISAFKDYHFNAQNDDSLPFDVYRNAGGFWNDYKQLSQEIRLSSQVGGLVDYQFGYYYIDVLNRADYRRSWGPDAGAWFASNAQYARLDVPVNPDGSVSGGQALMRNSLAGVAMSYNSPAGLQRIENESNALFGQANWHLGERLTLTTGARVTKEDRRNTTWSGLRTNGAGGELNPVRVRDVEMGGFDSNASTGLLTADNSAERLALADLVANKYFGVPITGAAGDAYRSLTADQARQVADAKAIRQSQIGIIFNPIVAEPFQDTQYSFVLSPSFAFNDNVNGYVSWQYGEKAGISQTSNGFSNPVLGEENSAFEIGVKGVYFDGNFTLNADYFHSDIKNYQQAVRIVDEYSTALNQAAGDETVVYTTATGNVPKVRAKGFEVDGTWSGIPYTQVRFSAAVSDAYYVEFPNAAVPGEIQPGSIGPYWDVSGQTLAGHPDWSGSVGFDTRWPVWGDKEFHVSANVSFTDDYNSDTGGSIYGWIDGYSVVDLAFGLGRANRGFDVSLLAKNVLDEDAPTAIGSSNYTPREPRWWGVVFTGSF